MDAKTSGVAVVTGAADTIGRAVARRLAHDGFTVVAQYYGNAARTRTLVSEIVATGGRAVAVEANIAYPSEVKALFAEAEACLGEIDVVVHCAGAGSLRRAREGGPDFPDHATSELRGTLFVLSQAAKCLFNGGRIVFFSGDLYAKSSWRANGRHVFSAVRVEDVVSRLADCMRRRNITVNALSPKSIAESLQRGDREGKQRQDRLLQPIQRVDGPEDIASVISFLVGPQGGWVNGQVIRGNCAFA